MSKPTSVVGGILLILIVATTASSWVRAQAIYGAIDGSVRDESGGVLPGIEIVITDSAKNVSWTVLTDDSGYFRKERLVPGSNYQVKVSLPGFKSFIRENLVVEVDSIIHLEIVLSVGEITENVTVSSSTPLLKREKTDVSVTFSDKQLEELPIFERNFTSYELLVPGTQLLAWQHSPAENPQGSRQIMVNGQQFGGTGYELDGTSNRDPLLGIIVINPTLEGVTEAKVTTQNYSAEFGQATAGIVTAQTKSGTNDFHGSAFLFRRNDQSQARDPFSQSQPLDPEKDPDKFIPDTLWSQFGLSLGGPIVKDKVFFFWDYQGTRRKNGGSLLTTVPTLAAREGDLSELIAATGKPIFDPVTGDPQTGKGRLEFPGGIIPPERISPQAQAFIKMLPAPNLPGIENNFQANGIEAFDDNAFNVRGDWILSEDLHLFGRYSFADFERQAPGAFGDLLGGQSLDGIGFSGQSTARNQSIAAGFDYTVNPSVLTDFRFGFFRYKVDVLPGSPGSTPAADVGIPGLNEIEGIEQDPIFTSGTPAFTIEGTGGFKFGFGLSVNGCNCPLDQSEQQWQWVSNTTISSGNHNIKFGVDFRYATNTRIDSGLRRAGDLVFNSARTQGDEGGGLGLATFLLGDVSRFGRFVSPFSDQSERQWRTFYYGQDTWKVTSRFTLNYGLRWEIYFPEAINKPGRGGFFDFDTGEILVAQTGDVNERLNVANSFTNFAPRAGITYQLSENSVFRLGYGRSFDTGVFGSIFGMGSTINLPVLAVQQLQDDNFKSVFNLAEGPPAPPFPQPGPNGRFMAPDGVSFQVRPKDIRLPTVDSWNITYQTELPWWDLTWEIGYVGNKGTHVGNGDEANLNVNDAILEGFAEGVPINERKPFFNGPINGIGGPYGLSQRLNFFCNCADNNYHSLQTKVEKRFSKGWSLLAHYTLARARNVDRDFFIHDADLQKGPANHDRLNTFVVNSLVELPFGRGRRFGADMSRTMDAILGGWQVNFITTWASGLPFSPTFRDCGAIADTGPCRPNVVGDPDINGDRNLFFAVCPNADCSDPNSPFAVPERGTFGNAGRNSLRGPSFINTDLSIFKQVAMPWFNGEEARWEFRAEIFNLFNKVNLARPGAARFNGGACVDCNPAQDGRITSLAPGTRMRQVQWALIFRF